MKTFGLCFILVMAFVGTYAQDLIVTHEGDTINCKITRQRNDYIYFTYKQDGVVHNTLLPVEQISKIQKNYFSISTLEPEEMPKTGQKTNYFRFAIDGGWAYRIAKVYDYNNELVEDYLKKLRSGFHVGLSAQHYWGEYFGFGIDYSLFQARNSDDGLNIYGNKVNIEDCIRIQYLGPAWYMRLVSQNGQNSFYTSVGIGYLWYIDKGYFEGEKAKMTGSSLGTNCSIGYDVGISRHAALGFKLTLIGGSFHKYKHSIAGEKTTVELPEDENENLSHLTLSIGLRFMGKTR